MKEYLVGKADAWIKASEIQISHHEDNSSPFIFLLVDYQELIEDDRICTYKRTVEQINDASRIEDASLYLTELEDKNHQIIFHSINIIRDRTRINALDKDKICINRREKSLENHVTDNRLTVSLSIDDLRVGDIIDYSATDIIHAGEHPLNGKFYHRLFWLNWNCPVFQQKVRIVNHSKKVIHVQRCEIEGGEHSSDIIDIKPNQEFLKDYNDLSSMLIEETAPNWLWSNFLLAATDIQWSDLSAYLYNSYASLGVLDNDIEIRDLSWIKLTDNAADNIIKVVRFVQNEIRYKGENFGVFTHTPKKPEQTLKKRYGDCKDKSNLMLALLEHIGIKANLTLVNSDYGLKINHLNPSPYLFNHMIVHVEFNDKNYFFDPTIKKQAGDIEHSVTLTYSYGLILSEKGSTLQKIPHNLEQTVFNLQHVFDFSDNKESENTLSIYRSYFRHRADNMRYFLHSTNNKTLASDFLKYAKEEIDLDLSAKKSITIVEDDEVLNILKTEEIYSIKHLKSNTGDDLLHLLTDIYSEFPVPSNTNFPLRINLDGNITHDIEVIYKTPPMLPNNHKIINNAWFCYEDSISTKNNTLYLFASAFPTKQHVETKEIDVYLEDVEEMRLRSVNNFPYKSNDISSIRKIGNWMLISSGIILYIIMLMTQYLS